MLYNTKTVYTFDEIQKMSYALFFRRRLFIIISLLFDFYVWSAAIKYLKYNNNFSVYVYGIIFVFIAILFPLMLLLIPKNNANLHYKTNKSLRDQTTEFMFFEDRVDIRNQYSFFHLYYSNIYKIVETKTNFYIFQSAGAALIIVKNNCSRDLIDFLNKLMIDVKNNLYNEVKV